MHVCAAHVQAPVTPHARISFFLPADLRPLWDETLSRFKATARRACIPPESAVYREMSDLHPPWGCLYRGNMTFREIVPLFLEELVGHFLLTWLTLTEVAQACPARG